jgi:metallo-beta-lactamase family protein
LGGAGTVTGSKYLLTFQGRRILVDCGLFQGLKELRLRNWSNLGVDAKSIDAIVLTHAHIDHSGYIPRLIKEGFRGKVHCTAGTLALCRVLLPDTGYLQEEEAAFLNRKKLSKHNPALPLFSKEDAEDSLRHFVSHGFHTEFEVTPGFRARFYYAGHILGAAFVKIQMNGTTIAFSGDIGRQNDPILRPPEVLQGFDYLVTESTYGDRRHPATDPADDLAKIVTATSARGGAVIIPAFAVGRAQELLYYLAKLKKEKRIPAIPMYLNSPMATSVTEILFDYPSLHTLKPADCQEMRDCVRYVHSAEDSKLLNQRDGPMVIISASGMASGGRVLHHLKRFAPEERNTIVLAGYQAAGTRGRSLQDRAPEIKIHGEFVPVRAEVVSIENLSAHADQEETVTWLRAGHAQPRKVFVTHGEPSSAAALAVRLKEEFGWNCQVPSLGDICELEK